MLCARNRPCRAGGNARPWLLLPIFALTIGFTCGSLLVPTRDRDGDRIERYAQEFVTLALAFGRGHDGEIDAYFGPRRFAAQAHSGTSGTITREALRVRAQALLAQIDAEQLEAPSPRGARLAAQVRSFAALLDTMDHPPSFEAEARAVYGLDATQIDPLRQRVLLRRLDTLLPGDAPLAERVAAYRDRFAVPEAKLRAVFNRALAECRGRTLAHWSLPADEWLEVEWTRKVAAAWHRYEGSHRSRVQINPAAVRYLGSAIDIACHEGYPGHHAQFVLMDAATGVAGLPIEDTVVVLRSPTSVLREGAADYGVDLAFPYEERVAFTRDVLFPIAGFEPAEAAVYVEVHCLVTELALSTVAILRDYRNGRLPPAAAEAQLRTEALVSSPRALLRFVDQFGAYAIGYTVARDAVRDAVTARSRASGIGTWRALRELLVQPDIAALRSPGKRVLQANAGASASDGPARCSTHPSTLD